MDLGQLILSCPMICDILPEEEDVEWQQVADLRLNEHCQSSSYFQLNKDRLLLGLVLAGETEAAILAGNFIEGEYAV